MSADSHQAPIRRHQFQLVGMSWAHFINDGAANFLPGILPAILVSLDMPVSLVGTLMTALLVGQGVQPFVGLLGDRIGGRSLTLAGLVGSSLGAGLVGLATSPAMLVGVLVLIGISNAFFHPQALVGVRQLSAGPQGLAMSSFLAGGEVGRGVWPVLASACVALGGVRWLWLLALPGLVSVFWLARCAPALPMRRTRASLVSWRSHLGGVTRLVLYCSLRSFATYAVTALLPLMWSAGGGSLTPGASLIAVLTIVGVVGNLGGGWLADHLGSRRLLVAAMGLSAVCALVLTQAGGLWLWLVTAVLGIGLFATLPLTVLIAQDLLPENRSFGSGLSLGLANALGAVAMIVIGPIVDAGGTRVGLLVAAATMVAAAILALWVPQRSASPRTAQA